MVTFWLTLGPKGMDQLSSGLNSEAVSQINLTSSELACSFSHLFCWLSQYVPHITPSVLVSDSSSLPCRVTALEKVLLSLVPPFPSPKTQKFAFTHSLHLPLKLVTSYILSPVLTGQSDLPPVSPTFRQSSYAVTTPWCEEKNSHLSLNKQTTSFQRKA